MANSHSFSPLQTRRTTTNDHHWHFWCRFNIQITASSAWTYKWLILKILPWISIQFVQLISSALLSHFRGWMKRCQSCVWRETWHKPATVLQVCPRICSHNRLFISKTWECNSRMEPDRNCDKFICVLFLNSDCKAVLWMRWYFWMMLNCKVNWFAT